MDELKLNLISDNSNPKGLNMNSLRVAEKGNNKYGTPKGLNLNSLRETQEEEIINKQPQRG